MVCVDPRRMLDYKQLGVGQNTIQKEYVKVCGALSRFFRLAKCMFFINLLSDSCGLIANILSYASKLAPTGTILLVESARYPRNDSGRFTEVRSVG